MSLCHREITRHGRSILYNGVPATCKVDAIKHDDNQRERHDDTLDQVSRGYSEESAKDRVANDDNSSDDHCHMVVYLIEARKQCSDSFKSRCGVRDEEDKNGECGDAHQDILIIAKSS